MDIDGQKQAAARRAIEYVEEGMKLGLGTGSTAAIFVDLLGERVKEGLNVRCVPTSEATRVQAEGLGIDVTTLDEIPHLDLTIDGADELDDRLRLIKGGGGALLREKIVATASDKMIVIADASKLVDTLGQFPLPVEVVKFGLKVSTIMIEEYAREAGCQGAIDLRLAKDGMPYETDSGNYILDCSFGKITEPAVLAKGLMLVPGVVESGLFLGIADIAIVAGSDGVTLIEVA